jgi:radical SAM superfamily enzyme YgiQ (UPF0313 family)
MNALLLYPEFSPLGFWNFKETCRLVGAKYPASPLGMITMAALLPSKWHLRLIDLNTATLNDSDIDWADLVFIGGMLPQQKKFLQLIDRVHGRGKKVVAGGPDPTSQPEVYQSADYLVLGEVESSIQVFLKDLDSGVQYGTYRPDRRPDMIESPVPRFDLLDLKGYLMIGIQFSRGCPFNCEFCDIIELYGRNPRTKTSEQIIRELETLYALGYRGQVDFVDDNFIGQKQKAKEILRAVKAWSEDNGHPFFFSTEASINLADDEELLSLMRDLDFRYVFIGIESTDEEVLSSVHKKQNLNRDIKSDLHKIYSYGIVVNGGFILGFDQETSESARKLVDIIKGGSVVMSMIGLLYALPNTQLRRRLKRENRLLESTVQQQYSLVSTEIDQTTTGINFISKRPKEEIIRDYLHILHEVYLTKNYFNRCLNLGKVIRTNYLYKPTLKRMVRYALGFLKTVVKLGLRPSTSYYYWRNILVILLTNTSSIETVVNLMAMYLHFRPQTNFISGLMKENLEDLKVTAAMPLKVRAFAACEPGESTI